MSTSISIVNGQMRRTKEVTFTFVYQLHVGEPGSIEIGPFAITQGTASVTSRSLPPGPREHFPRATRWRSNSSFRIHRSMLVSAFRLPSDFG